ncbi:ABC transporter permease [Alsobacter sp. SYSU M60028]|uniref:ABC transporter permease n=1 Tax=Alsobacter ponti TaxID=2962936 RepID=A0ABT1L6V0_9HYPH|nr:ABC transporter permease [Alsobacter ponti]MCP8937154.1 ABC transporter permease [Alsobacter ponti]
MAPPAKAVIGGQGAGRPSTARGRAAWPADRLGSLLAAVGFAAAVLLPFMIVKANRIASGQPHGLADSLSRAGAAELAALLAVVAGVAMLVRAPTVRLAAALAGLAGLAAAVSHAASRFTPPGDSFARVSPGAGAWLMTAVLALLATDALARLRLFPGARVAALALAIAACWLAFRFGLFDQLSVMREYANRADVFAREARWHLVLAGGSCAVAVLIGLPLGILCHRAPRLRAGTLQGLNIVQTIPSIALFGMLMVPLGLLARSFPVLSQFGVAGIGGAPAFVALVLYALLPVTANTVAGLAQAPAAAVDAARGMGMTDGQVLREVELPLAVPVILTGIRIVLVQNIGLATVAALIGGGGFGTFVFQGLGQTAIDLVLLGAAPTVALAFCASVLLDAAAEAFEGPGS